MPMSQHQFEAVTRAARASFCDRDSSFSAAAGDGRPTKAVSIARGCGKASASPR